MYAIYWKTDTGITGNGQPLPYGLAKSWIDHMETRDSRMFSPFRFGKNKDNTIKHWLVKV
jgi:hypothetical protein